MNRVVPIIIGAVVVAIGLAVGIAYLLTPRIAPPTVVQITGITPTSGLPGTRLQLTINGAGFVLGASLRVSRAGESDMAVSEVTTLAADRLQGIVVLSNTGAWDVTVINPDGASAVCRGCLTVGTVSGAPTVTSMSPVALSPGASQELVITGTSFEDGASVSISGSGVSVMRTRFVSPTELRTSITVGASAPAGVRDVTVINPSLRSAVCSQCFTVGTGGPVAGALSPSTFGPGSASRPATLTGSGFITGARVTASSTGVTVTGTVTDPTHMTLRVTLSTSTAPGPVALTVINPDGQRTVCAACLTVSDPPRMTSLTPAQLIAGSSTTALITGSGFQRDAIVVFGAGIAVERFTFVDSGQVTAVINATSTAAAGPRTVTFTNPDGGTTALVDGFTVIRSTP